MTDKEKLRRIRLALAPPPRTGKALCYISNDAFHNLGGAIIDIEHGRCDAVVLRTLKRVERQVAHAQLALDGKPIPDRRRHQ